MSLKILFITLLLITNLFSLSTTSDDDYKVFESENYTIIYTPTNKNEAIYIKSKIDTFLKSQDNSFGFKFDEPLYISLISPNIQLANAFSTQIPYNETLFYGGGVQYIDYFSFSSWLDTLLYHEIAHNYQINSKNNDVSQLLHSTLGNNYLPLLIPIPLFTLPNLFLPTALLEGNSVLNESIYNNGGRLHNGRFKALTNLLVLHNRMDKTRFINDHLDFPYGEEKYIVGGYYMLYLANIYGVDKVNKLYQSHSKHYINPLLLNNTFSSHFKISFDDSFKNFIEETKKGAKDFNPKEDNTYLATSKKEIYLNKQDDKILFITNDGITKPILNQYNIQTSQNSQSTGNWLNGKVFKVEDEYYTVSQAFIKSTLYKAGLFDKDRFIKNDTTQKAIQDIYKDDYLYFDVSKSFDTPSLYLNNKYYDTPSSSAIFDDEGAIYYFKQEQNQRVLYKNKKKLFSFEGYFSKLSNIQNNTIYFIANSKDGTSLYKYDKGIQRVSNYDNIIDAKIISNNEALIVTINHNNYRVYKTKLEENKEKVFSTNLKLTTKESIKKIIPTTDTIKGKTYNELKELKFSYLYPSFTYSSEDGYLYTLDAFFLDPLMFNYLGVYAYKLEEERYVGLNYINERYIPFEINIYDSKLDVEPTNFRGYGGYLKVYGPLFEAGNHLFELDLTKYFEDENEDKAPAVLTATYNYKLDFGLSFKPYYDTTFETYLKEDREDLTYGAKYEFTSHLFSETYLTGSIKSIQSNTEDLSDDRGIKIYSEALTEIDNTNIYAPGIDDDFFVKDITKSSISLSKTINLNKYFFTFPISLRRESIYLDYTNYSYTQIKKDSFTEKTIGISLDTLLVHRFVMPIDIKYIENSASKNDQKILISIGVEL